MNSSVEYLPTLDTLTLEQKVAQMIMVDFPGYSLSDEVRDYLIRIPWGGVILFQKNVQNRKQLVTLNRQIMETNLLIPPFISVDQEGGLVNRADFSDMHLSPGAMALGVVDDPALTEEISYISGIELRELGFHVNFAPVMDVNINPRNPIIGVRSFGEEPRRVIRHGVASVRGFEKAGIASCAKHFPGHGDTHFDSHLALAAVDANRERIVSVELPPFKAAIDAGVPSMMTAHVIFPAVDETRLPATLSKTILTGLLREDMGFNGLIFTDSMGMKAIADHFGTGEAAVQTVLAGADIVMMCGTVESQMEAYEAILRAAKSGAIPMELIDKSVERILQFKEKYVVDPKPLPEVSTQVREEIIRKASVNSVKVLYDNSSVVGAGLSGKRAVVLSPDHLYKTMLEEYTDRWSIYPFLKNKFATIRHEIYDIDNPNLEALLEKVTGEDNLVFLEVYSRGILNNQLHNAFEEFITVAREQKITVVQVVLSSPYGIPVNADAAVTAYSFLEPSLQAMAEKIAAQ